MKNYFSKIGEEKVNGVSLLLFGIWIWWYTRDFPNLPEGHPGPELFPRLIGAGLILGGIILVFTRDSKPIEGIIPPFSNTGFLRIVISLVLVALYPLLRNYLGFITAISIVCFFMALLFRVRIWLAAISAVGAAFLIYALFFYLLGVYL